MSRDSAEVDGDSDEISDIYGDTTVNLVENPKLKVTFRPWHFPVKQIVREYQWRDLTHKLVTENNVVKQGVLRYFTLPGADLLDIRQLAYGLNPLGLKLEYFGFDSSRHSEESKNTVAWLAAESSLRQADRITAEALILPDDLEDVAIETSQAASQLRMQLPFDVVNIDACGHLAYSPKGRTKCTFDALTILLKHQMLVAKPWLLFLTTRVHPTLLGSPGSAFQKAVTDNVQMKDGELFKTALAAAIHAKTDYLDAAIEEAWASNDERFLRIYAIGLGKYLLQFFNAQPNLPADVELVSAYTYRVYGLTPDMLALAFRITPRRPEVFSPSTGGEITIPQLEIQRAAYIANRACHLWDIDSAINTDSALFDLAVAGTRKLLKDSDYDLRAWDDWRVTYRAGLTNERDLA